MRPLGERLGSGSNICGSRGCSWRRGGRWGGRRSPAIPVSAPTGDGAVAPHPAGVLHPSADGDEGPRGRRSLAVFIAAPAGDGAVAPHPASMVPGADGDEGTRGRRGPAAPVSAPTGDGAVAPHPAGVGVPSADGGEGTRGRRGWLGRSGCGYWSPLPPPRLWRMRRRLLYFRPLLQRNSPLRSQLATLNRCLEPRIHVSRSP